MVVYGATAAILLLYLVLAWFLGSWLHLKGPDTWVLRGGLALLGIIGVGVFLWFHRKFHLIPEADGGGSATPDVADVDLLVHEAVRKLRSSRIGQNASLGKLPLIFVAGEVGSTKTSTILASSLDPELLAGQVYQDNNVLPTRTANVFYARQVLFVDTAGDLLNETSKWSRLVRLSQPGRVSSAVQKGVQAPRAAIVCVECSKFLEPRASESMQAAARVIGSRLQQISQLLGITYPVYVLFTKADRLAGFAEFFRNFSKGEAMQVLGATVPVRPASVGVYAEEESRRMEKAFDELFYSLADRRMDVLGREYEADKRPAIYEFPREFGKIRKLLVGFLVDLARPSQLQVSPFLRGFYFSGVRPVVEHDVTSAAQNVNAEPAADAGAGATKVFDPGRLNAPPSPAAGSFGSRVVPQWVFLSQFFNRVLLQDQVAFNTSGISTRVSLFRRIALATVAALSLLFLLFFSVSFFENRSLKNEFIDALKEIPSTRLTDKQVAGLSDLQRLERLRRSVARMAEYDRGGPPWHMRWGLYIGDDLYPDARKLYFDRFQALLFSQTQGTILNSLRTLGPEDSFELGYSQLKAYLITTSEWKRSTVDFLSPVLLKNWAGKAASAENLALAKGQFDFYSTELAKGNPFSSQNDVSAITNARGFLANFGAVERIYRGLLAEVDKTVPSQNFNDKFPGSASVVVCRIPVPGHFTSDGYTLMKDELRQPTRAGGEDWVLGLAAKARLDIGSLQQQLSARYFKDYADAWRGAMRGCSVGLFINLQDAAQKLDRLTMPTSPLLELFYFVSFNTAVEQPSISTSFQPPQMIAPPGTPGSYGNPTNKPYTDALSKLQGQTDFCSKEAQPDTADSCIKLGAAIQDAEFAVKSLSTSFHLGVENDDRVSVETSRLLKEPIDNLERVRGSGVKDRLNGAARGLCDTVSSMARKFPFNATATEEVPLEVLNSVFAPKTGALWKFYDDQKMTNILPKTLTGYVPNPNAELKITPEFARFFDRMARLSDALYAQGTSPTPKVSFVFRQLPSNVDDLTLKIGTDTLAGINQQKTFTWTGLSTDFVEVSSKAYGSLESHSGVYAVHQLIQNAHGLDADLEWVIETNNKPQTLPNGKTKSFHYQLQVPGSAPNPLKPWEWGLRQCPLPAVK
jgi:type VI secretion system protein ImpL